MTESIIAEDNIIASEEKIIQIYQLIDSDYIHTGNLYRVNKLLNIFAEKKYKCSVQYIQALDFITFADFIMAGYPKIAGNILLIGKDISVSADTVAKMVEVTGVAYNKAAVYMDADSALKIHSVYAKHKYTFYEIEGLPLFMPLVVSGIRKTPIDSFIYRIDKLKIPYTEIKDSDTASTAPTSSEDTPATGTSAESDTKAENVGQ